MKGTKNIFFTFLPTESGGVTDQLIQFSAWYKLGRSLGYIYVHPEMHSGRSGSRVYEYLGFDAIWKNQRPYPGHSNSKKTVKLSSSRLRYQYSWGFAGLKWYVRTAVRRMSAEIMGDNLLVIFQLEAPGDRAIFNLIERSVRAMPDGIHLRESYFRQRRVDPRESKFQSVGLRVLVHIRQGDATVLPTPWSTYMSVYSTSVAEFDDLNATLPAKASWDQQRAMRSIVSYTDPHDYFLVLQALVKSIGSSPYSIVISSDGYAKTFDTIKQSARRLDLTEIQLQQLHEMEMTYDKMKYQEFYGISNLQMLLGESDENLLDLIHSALNADVIISSAQQQMMVKLLYLYGRQDNPPLVVMLNNDRVQRRDIEKRLSSRVRGVVFINTSQLVDKRSEYVAEILTRCSGF